MGLAHSGLHEKDKAKVAFAEAIAADPTDARPYNALGDIQRLSRDYGKSIVTYQRSIEADPTYMESYGDLARVKFNTQDTEGVVPLLQKALKIDDTYAEGQRLLGIALNQLERYHEAIAPLNRALDLDDSYCETYYRLSEAHYGMGNFRQAIEHGRRATSCQADYSAAEVLLGDAHFQLGQRQEARRWYNLVLKDSRFKDYAASKLEEAQPAVPIAPMVLLLASNNPGKLREVRALLADVEVVVPAALGLDLDVEESGQTFAANAQLKARAYAAASGHIALADDSGLEVDALGGAPGIYSARYGGPDLDDAGRCQLLLTELAPYPEPAQRRARFRCVLCAVSPDGRQCRAEGTCEGLIAPGPGWHQWLWLRFRSFWSPPTPKPWPNSTRK